MVLFILYSIFMYLFRGNEALFYKENWKFGKLVCDLQNLLNLAEIKYKQKTKVDVFAELVLIIQYH